MMWLGPRQVRTAPKQEGISVRSGPSYVMSCLYIYIYYLYIIYIHYLDYTIRHYLEN